MYCQIVLPSQSSSTILENPPGSGLDAPSRFPLSRKRGLRQASTTVKVSHHENGHQEAGRRDPALEASDDYRATKHQRFVGTGYFDQVTQCVTRGESSTTALCGSTEEAQFEAPTFETANPAMVATLAPEPTADPHGTHEVCATD